MRKLALGLALLATSANADENSIKDHISSATMFAATASLGCMDVISKPQSPFKGLSYAEKGKVCICASVLLTQSLSQVELGMLDKFEGAGYSMIKDIDHRSIETMVRCVVAVKGD